MEAKQLQIIRCAGCGEFLPAGRRNLRFHGSACRSRFWRRRRDIELHSQLIQGYLADWNEDEILELEFDVLNEQMRDIYLSVTALLRRLEKMRLVKQASREFAAERGQG